MTIIKITMATKKLKMCAFLLLTFVTASVFAQYAVPAAGGDATGAGGSSAYSVGQVVYISVSGAGSVNQGVQQPYVIIATSINNQPDINLTMSVYPNPSITSITLNVGKLDFQNLSFQLFDVQGKLVAAQKITSIETTIKMEEYNSGNYFLNVVDATKELKTFKIIKN
jgi:hypothetical protein